MSPDERNAKRHTASYSLRGQLGILFAALAVPLLLLQGWWSYHDYRGARERAWADALAFADAVDMGVRQFVDQSSELLQASAEQSGEGWLTEGSCSDDLSDLRDVLPFDNVLLVRTEGWVVCSAAPVPPAASAVDWTWFSEFRETEAFTVAPPAESDFTSSWVLPLVAPIHDDAGELRGALVGTLPLIELSRLLGRFRPPGEQLTTLATQDGVVIARSADAEQWLGRHLPPPTGSDRQVGPERWVAEGPDLTGVVRTWGQVQTESGWIVYVGIPDTVVFGPARREALAHVGGTLLVVLIGVVLATISYSRIARALRELAEKTKAGDAGMVVPLPPDTPREITEVVEQFNATLRGRARAESAERAARERFQSIFDNAVFGIYVATADGLFLQVNPALVAMLGYPSEEALLEVGPAALYRDPERRGEVVREIVDGKGAEPGTTEVEWVRADGTPIIVRVGGIKIDGPEGEEVLEMIVQDITDEKRTEDQLRQTQKMEAIGQLAGGVAHDFNNLLTVISGNVELLDDDLDETDPLREDLDQIAKATQRASSLTRRLLTFSRSSRRGERTVDVDEVIPELETMLSPLVGERVKLEARLDEGPHLVAIDPGELEQLVVNLVLNARDAIPGDGSIVIETVRRAQARESAVVDGMALSVTDDGMGMDTLTRERVFEPFYTTKPMGEGTGLGLSTVYGIVQRAGGDIDVESEPGRGTRITVWLPLVSAPAEVPPDEPVPERATGTESILVVEDDELVRSLVGRALRDSGFQVEVTAGGHDALAVIRERAEPIDLVLSDVVMPGMSGPEFAEQLRIEAPDTPILFMSGYVDNDFFNEELEQRPEALLRKPFTLTELHTRVREALDRSTGVLGGSNDAGRA